MSTLVPKGWGHEEIIINTPAYCGKKLLFDKNKRASWHYHKKKDECFYLERGKVQIFVGKSDDITKAEMHILEMGDSLHLPPGTRHQVIALEDSVIIEFSTHDSPSDTIRITRGD